MSADFPPQLAAQPSLGRSRNALAGAILGSGVAFPATAWLWGFTVDDALITARVATHLARGLGARFNPSGPLADAVTPLGYAQLLAWLSPSGDVLATLFVAKWFGLVCWLAAAALLGALVTRAGERWLRFTPLLLVALSAPLAAWAVSGMETGFITLLATLGLLGGMAGAGALGLAAALRPELLPFAVALVMSRLYLTRAGWLRVLVQVALLAVPVLCVALLRFDHFGRWVPLSFYAKPSDFAHGFRYACGAFAFTGLPWLLLATPGEWARLPRAARALFVALAAHAGGLILCGGDWMSLYRLAVPVLPCAALAAALLAEQARWVFATPRLVMGLSGALLLAMGLGPDARRVGAARSSLIEHARPVLAHDSRIAGLDVGWLGAASDANIIDLAGVTDPQVAAFVGGHTSKRIPGHWLFAQRPSAIVLLLAKGQTLQVPFADSVFSRAVEQRVARLVADDFQPRTALDLAGQTYLVLEPKPVNR